MLFRSAAMAPSACSGVLMYAAVSLSRGLLPDGVGGIARMFLLILAGAVTYIVASVLFNRRGLREVISTARSLATLGGGSSSVE